METVNIKDKIFDFAYELAFRDATMRKAYQPQQELKEMDSDAYEKANIRKKARDIVKEYVDGVVAGKFPDFYETAQKVNKCVADPEFRFGNIQKLLNMTIKYIYIGYYTNPEIRSNFKKCHCPMDGIMLAKVVNDYNELENKNEEYLKYEVEEGKYSRAFSEISWSNIEFDDGLKNKYSRKIYDNYQEMVKILAKRKGLIPIEYNYDEWNLNILHISFY